MTASLRLAFALAVACGMGMSSESQAADTATTSEPLRLWSGDAPGALGSEPKDIPTLTSFPAPAYRATGAAIIVFPGGGYANLTAHEGDNYARWLSELGIHAFVLRYRLGSKGYRHPAMLQDASRSVRMVRSRAAEWNIDAKRIGIIGSSAGGHLASTLMTHYDGGDPESTDTIERESSRPDLAILCYPVISLGEKGHRGSEQILLGPNAHEDLRHLLSNEFHVTSETCPTFLFHTADDPVVPVENSLLFATALAGKNVPFALHIYSSPRGSHGLGLGTAEWNPEARHPWTVECAAWLKEQGFAR